MFKLNILAVYPDLTLNLLYIPSDLLGLWFMKDMLLDDHIQRESFKCIGWLNTTNEGKAQPFFIYFFALTYSNLEK